MMAQIGPLLCLLGLGLPVQDPAPTKPVDPNDAPRLTDPYMPMYSSGHRYWSRTSPPPQHQRQPSSASSSSDADFGFRNPGGVGRVAEFYPPNNQFQNGGTAGKDPVVAAQFGSGSPDLSRSMQLRSQQIGIQRSNALHQQIDALARPMGGFGFGFGGGFYPY